MVSNIKLCRGRYKTLYVAQKIFTKRLSIRYTINVTAPAAEIRIREDIKKENGHEEHEHQYGEEYSDYCELLDFVPFPN